VIYVNFLIKVIYISGSFNFLLITKKTMILKVFKSISLKPTSGHVATHSNKTTT